jgi:endonuclease/exonuclease/phosphatase family metal-dependent hydrolase
MIYNLHLESRGDNYLRMLQLSETIDDAKRYLDTYPTVLAGDLNLDVSRSSSSSAVLQDVGFHSAIALPVSYTTPAHGIFRQQRAIDWVYLAGPVESIGGGVCNDVNASDHYPVWFDIRLTAP